jgi:hypothetical protein
VGASSINTCQKCPAGSTLNSDVATCKLCVAGKYGASNDPGYCSACSWGKFNDEAGLLTCDSCPASKYSNSGGSSSCATCVAGTYSAAGANQCMPCAAGTYSSEADATCTDCAAGKYSDATGASTCQLCGGGKYSLPYETSVVDAFPVGVQKSYSTSLLSGLSCILCYDEPYSKYTTNLDIETCKSTGGGGRWIAMGSKSSSTATSFDVLAFIPANALVTIPYSEIAKDREDPNVRHDLQLL